jgi:hypothetical protein
MGNQDYETTKNTGGQMTPAPAKKSAPPVPLTDQEQQANVDRLMAASGDRQQQRGENERQAASGKAAKIETIFKACQFLSRRGLITAHGVWQYISLNGVTPRPSSNDEFIQIIREMVHTNRLEITGGNLGSPTTKLYLKVLEHRID